MEIAHFPLPDKNNTGGQKHTAGQQKSCGAVGWSATFQSSPPAADRKPYTGRPAAWAACRRYLQGAQTGAAPRTATPPHHAHKVTPGHHRRRRRRTWQRWAAPSRRPTPRATSPARAAPTKPTAATAQVPHRPSSTSHPHQTVPWSTLWVLLVQATF